MTAMNELNAILASAFDSYKSIFDNVLAVMSLYVSTWLLSSHYDRVSKHESDSTEQEAEIAVLRKSNALMRHWKDSMRKSTIQLD